MELPPELFAPVPPERARTQMEPGLLRLQVAPAPGWPSMPEVVCRLAEPLT